MFFKTKTQSMKKTLLIVAFSILTTAGFAQTWSLDKAHSKAGFTVTHNLISEVDGYFKKIEASIIATKPDLSDAVFEMTAETASINTENEMRDGHLKGDNFFDAAKFPVLVFKSTSFMRVNGNKYKMKGNLTIKGITKAITMDVTLLGPNIDERSKKQILGIKATTVIDRQDFKIGTSLAAKTVSDDVELRATGEFKQN